MNINRITISSEDNPDWNGTWDKKDVVDEVAELDLADAGTNWVEYIINMCLDFECPDEAIETLINTSEIRSIELVLPSGTVKITKF